MLFLRQAQAGMLLTQEPTDRCPQLDLRLVRAQHEVSVSLPLRNATHPARSATTNVTSTPRSYEQSTEGYNAKEKRQELFDPESRFLVLSSPPVAYAVFRFDTEETATKRDAEVVYW